MRISSGSETTMASNHLIANEGASEAPQTTTEIIVEKIKNAIFDGTLPPGHRLREVELVEQMKTSRTPIREAFRILQSNGYLVHMRRCGVVVAGLDGEELHEMWELRSIVESAAAARAAKNITSEELEQLLDAQDRAEAMCAFSPLDYNRMDSVFHSLVAKASRNRKLEETIDRLWQVSTLARTRSLFWKERVNASCREHRDIISAIQRGDSVLARRYMEVHFENSIKTIKSIVRNTDLSRKESVDSV